MNELLLKKIEAFFKEATPDSILEDCIKFGIQLEDICIENVFYVDLNENIFKSIDTVSVFKNQKIANYELAA